MADPISINGLPTHLDLPPRPTWERDKRRSKSNQGRAQSGADSAAVEQPELAEDKAATASSPDCVEGIGNQVDFEA
jgi:hypothetical protein